MFTDWLTRASEKLINYGTREAYCKLCLTPLRAQKTDLEKHSKTKTHKVSEKKYDLELQPSYFFVSYLLLVRKKCVLLLNYKFL